MKTLIDLYKIHAPSGNEDNIKKYIQRWIKENVGIDVTYDAYGNMYITKGLSETYPCVVAHLDQVQTNHSSDFKVIDTGEILFGYSNKNRRMEGLGADDKNGVWIALQCLKKYDVIKIAFFVEEECGTIGSSHADMDFFSDCRFILEPDRRGKSDLITSIYSDICSEDFLSQIYFEDFGYQEQNGMLTDVATLGNNGVGISCLNISCGYYNPHSDEEFTNKADLLNCLHFVENIIETCTDVYPHKIEPRYKSYGTTYGKNTYYDWYDRDYHYTKDNKSVSDDIKLEVFELMDENPEMYPEEVWDILGDDIKKEISYEEFIDLAYEYWYYYYYNDKDVVNN